MLQIGMFDLENRYSSLSEAGDTLERLDKAIDWEIFRSILNRIDIKGRKSKAGRKPLCRVMMFKLLILQRLHNLSDERLQYQVTDRLSFMRFLGLDLSASVPDARTVWAFKESLREQELMEPLFDRFYQVLAGFGVSLKSGQIIDATFVSVPIQRNSAEDNALIKQGETPVEWSEKPAKLAQKDVDARWAKKCGKNHYGYKNHINIDRDTKLITEHSVTSAEVHDSQVMPEILRVPEEENQVIHADSAYVSEETEVELKKQHYDSQIHERAYRNKPLTEDQKTNNRKKSRIRVRVEHVFGAMKNEMGGIFLRTIGIARAKLGIGLMNLTYNLKRIETLIRLRRFNFDRLTASKMQKMA